MPRQHQVSSKELKRKVERCLDDALDDSFPASDPVSFLQAAPVKEGDKELCTVKVNGQRATSRAKR
jgi:hypothetical protein